MAERPLRADFDATTDRWALHGDLAADTADDAAALDRLWMSLDAMADRDVVVDLSDVDHLPSRALGVLAVARRVAAGRGGSLSLVAEEGTVARAVLLTTAMLGSG